MTAWQEWIGATRQLDGTAVLIGRGPMRPYILEVNGPQDASVAMQDCLVRQWNEHINKDQDND